jgi:rod shape-determining protein MreD
MNRKEKLLIYFLFLFIIQIYLLDLFKIFSVRLDLFVPALVNLGISYSLSYVLGFGFFLGLLEDLLSNYHWGINSFIFFLAGYLIYRIKIAFFIEQVSFKILIVILICLLMSMVKAMFLYFYGILPTLDTLLKINFIYIFYTTIFSIPIFKTMDSLCQ